MPALLGLAAETKDAVATIDAGPVAICRSLPNGPEKRAVADFVARGWNNSDTDPWKHHPSALRYSETIARLKTDASAPLMAKNSAQ